MRKKHKAYLTGFVIFLIVFASCFRLSGLTFQSMWLDELLSLNHSNPSQGISEPIRYAVVKDASPPLFNILLLVWRIVFGSGEYSARALPALFGILGVLSIFFLGMELFSTKVGIFASLFIAVLPFHIYYSQEVRPYSLLFLLCVLSYFFFIKLIKQKKIVWALLYVVSTSCMLYTNYFGFLVLIAQILYLAVVFLCDKTLNRWNFLKSYLPVGIMLTLTYLPWMQHIHRLMKVKKNWADLPSTHYFVSYFKSYFGDERYAVFMFVFFIGLYLLYKSRKGELPYHKVMLISSLLVAYVVPYLRSLRHAVVLTSRNSIIAVPAIILMACIGLDRLKRIKLQVLFLGLILLTLLVNIFYTNGNYYTTITKEQWRGAARYVFAKDPEGRYPIFVNGNMKYYFVEIFHTERIQWPAIETADQAKKANAFISGKKWKGFWVIEMHRRMDVEARKYLDDLYRVRIRKILKGGRITFYVSREPPKQP